MPTNRLIQPKSLDDMLLYQLWGLQAAVGRMVVRLCESEFGISRREWRVLAQLAQHAGLSSSALAECASLDRAQTSRAVSRLVAKRLLSRERRPGNRREVWLCLTTSGRDVYAALLPRVAHINRDVLSVLSDAEAAEFEHLLLRLRQQAERMAAGEQGGSER